MYKGLTVNTLTYLKCACINLYTSITSKGLNLTPKQKKHLLGKLSKLAKIPNINNGGCAIVALHLQDYIKRAYNRDSTIVYLMRNIDKTGITNLRNNTADSCYHALVKVGNTYYDTDGSYTRVVLHNSWKNTVAINITKELVELSIAKKHMWNHCYDRRSNSTIKSILKD